MSGATLFRWPTVTTLPDRPRRLIVHWTGGGHTSSCDERRSYHLLVEHMLGEPDDPTDDIVRVVSGVPMERNLRPLHSSDPSAATDPETGYAAHTRGLNSYSIGLSLCGMRRAVDRRGSHTAVGPVDPGPEPITRLQVEAMIQLAHQWCRIYSREPDADTVFCHWEAEYLHGIDQLPIGRKIWKWDVTYLPGLELSRVEAGPWIRAQIERAMRGEEIEYFGATRRGERSGENADGMEEAA